MASGAEVSVSPQSTPPGSNVVRKIRELEDSAGTFTGQLRPTPLSTKSPEQVLPKPLGPGLVATPKSPEW